MLLTIAAKRMASENVLVKSLTGVETLGAITLLATDKTGTLTRNQMTVANLWTCGELYEAAGRVGDEKDAAQPDKPGVMDILHISSLCSRAKFDRTDVSPFLDDRFQELACSRSKLIPHTAGAYRAERDPWRCYRGRSCTLRGEPAERLRVRVSRCEISQGLVSFSFFSCFFPKSVAYADHHLARSPSIQTTNGR
jgi:hypothetical protein